VLAAASCDTGTAVALALTPAALAAILGALAGWQVQARRRQSSHSEAETSHDRDGGQDSAA
jgi:hypothetical protein